MPDFSHLKKYDVQGTQTADYVFAEIEDESVMVVLPATESNKPFFNAMLRRSRKNAKTIQSGAISANLIAQNRDEDRELYAQYIIKGWRNVKDSQGIDVVFTQQNCLEYLNALPDRLFDDLRQFCGNSINFIKNESPDVEGTAKN